MAHKRTTVEKSCNQDASARSLDPVETGAENLTPRDAVQVAHDDIARRAYDLYEQRGCVQGQCRVNWLQAERELQGAR